MEQEEEYLVNNLQRRLAKVCATLLSLHLLACSAYAVCIQVNEEKAALESRLTSEQEYLDNQLQKKVCRW